MTEQVNDITTLPKTSLFTKKRVLIGVAVVGAIATIAAVAQNRSAVENLFSDAVPETPQA